MEQERDDEFRAHTATTRQFVDARITHMAHMWQLIDEHGSHKVTRAELEIIRQQLTDERSRHNSTPEQLHLGAAAAAGGTLPGRRRIRLTARRHGGLQAKDGAMEPAGAEACGGRPSADEGEGAVVGSGGAQGMERQCVQQQLEPEAMQNTFVGTFGVAR